MTGRCQPRLTACRYPVDWKRIPRLIGANGREGFMRAVFFARLAAALALAVPAAAQQAAPPVLAAQTRGTPAERAAQVLAQMTLDEKLTLLKGYFGTDFPVAKFEAPAEARAGSAGYVPGIPRLG